MKTSRFTDSQILAILKQAENGIPVPDLCREHGISRPHTTNGVQSSAVCGGVEEWLPFKEFTLGRLGLRELAPRHWGWYAQ